MLRNSLCHVHRTLFLLRISWFECLQSLQCLNTQTDANHGQISRNLVTPHSTKRGSGILERDVAEILPTTQEHRERERERERDTYTHGIRVRLRIVVHGVHVPSIFSLRLSYSENGGIA